MKVLRDPLWHHGRWQAHFPTPKAHMKVVTTLASTTAVPVVESQALLAKMAANT